jgi:hypothetical protein
MRPTRRAVRRAALFAWSLCALAGAAAGPPSAAAQSVSTFSDVQISPPDPRVGEGPVRIFYTGSPTGIEQVSVSGSSVDLLPGFVVYCPSPPPIAASRVLPPLAEGSYTVNVRPGALNPPYETFSFNVGPPRQALALRGSRFRVSLSRSGEPGGIPVPANAVKLTDQSGYFWFYDGDNVEVTVKILDGRALNGHFWVFAASMTDRPFTLQIEDLGAGCPLAGSAAAGAPAGCLRSYSTTAQNQNILDVEAFGS